MKQTIIIILSVILFVFSISIIPNYQIAKEYNSLEYYELPDNSVKIFNYNGGGAKVNIPDKINGKRISNIATKSIGYKTENGKRVKISDFLINGYYGSEAYAYAKENKLLFNCLHSFKEEVVKEPTYAKQGVLRKTCDCGFVYSEKIDCLSIPDVSISSISALGEGVKLSWNVKKGVDYYNIYRSVDGGEFEKIVTAKGNKFTDYEADSGLICYYIAGTAGENEGKHAVSPVNISYLKTPHLILDSTEKGILLKWENSKNAAKYRVYKKDENGEFKQIYETADNSEYEYIDTNVQKQSEYSYAVVSVDKNNKESSRIPDGKSLIFGRHTKVVHLTFDDGPSENTLKIINILKKYDAKATFFVTAGGKTEYMKNIVDEGHTIALHTYSHDYGEIYSSTSSYFKDLYKIQELVKKKTGVDARIIRFPGGSSNTISAQYSSGIMTELTQQVVNDGFKYFDWNINSGDADGENVPADTILKNVKIQSADVDNCVVLMHDTAAKNTTVQALDKICAYYKSQGYEFYALTANSVSCHQEVNN